ncbi:MAG TPA: HAMP domain-containing sensor histidine kinase [Anaeromyxobacteraceae bacterium]|nr:HAMP domain-containing sensor histidine kinase [Anaeromyxobacteraceae bacterium]
MFAGYVVVVLGFLAVTIFTQHRIQRIDEASDDIARNAMPTIQQLGKARQSVGQLEVALLTWMKGPADPGPEGRAAIEGPLRRLVEQVDGYLALPLFPGEQPRWEDVGRTTQGLAEATHRMMGQLEARAPALAWETYSAEVIPAVRRLYVVLSDDIDFNAQNGARLAQHIKSIRVQGEWVGLLLDVLCGLVASLAGLIVHGEMRRHDALMAEHARLLEERAGEFESFAGRVAHDIMNPVGAAQLALDLEARRRRAAGQLPGEELQRAERSVRRVRTLVDGLLRFARAGARPDPGATADVVEVIEDVLSGADGRAAQAGLTLATELTPGTVACDKGVLTSLVANLVDNAIKYAGAGGRVAVRVATEPAAVRVEVEDGGPGLPEDLEDRVFQPYVRGAVRDKPGLGLGLATVKRLAEAHGGRVGVHSQPGRGSTFWFELPRAAPGFVSTSTTGPA